jgi:hypothetical protein
MPHGCALHFSGYSSQLELMNGVPGNKEDETAVVGWFRMSGLDEAEQA